MGRPPTLQTELLHLLNTFDDGDFFEYGVLPLSASVLSEITNRSVSQVAHALRVMEKKGLVTSEVVVKDVWNAIARSPLPRKTRAYWPTETSEAKRAQVNAYQALVSVGEERALVLAEVFHALKP